jgi:hypothetical protein
MKINKCTSLIIVLLLVFIHSLCLATENTPFYLKINIDTEIKKKEIKRYANNNGWEKTYQVIRGNMERTKENIGEWIVINGCLYSPTLLWIEANYYIEHMSGTKDDVDNYFLSRYIEPNCLFQ